MKYGFSTYCKQIPVELLVLKHLNRPVRKNVIITKDSSLAICSNKFPLSVMPGSATTIGFEIKKLFLFYTKISNRN